MIFPVFLLAIALAMQAALWFSARNTAVASAQEGLRVARAQDGTVAAGQAAALQLAGWPLRSSTARVSTGAGQTIVVQVRGRVPSFVPGLTIDVVQEARGPKERWTTPSQGRA